MRMMIATMAVAAALAGCAPGGMADREAGSILDTGTFGNATMNNNMAQRAGANATISLGRRFAAEVPTTINFAFDQATLDAQAQAVLRQQADWIRQFPEVRFRVYGHTDLVGSEAYNRALGLRRAQAAVAYLTAQGISRDRLEAVASFGQTQPVIQTPGPERQNRRTVTEVTGFVGGDAMLLNGKYAQVIFREYVASATSQTTLGGISGAVAGGE